MRNHNCKSPRRYRKGTVAVLTACMLVVIFGMVAFAIDVGYITHARAEFQRTADSSALAAAMYLPDQDKARQVAVSLADTNKETVGPNLETSDVEFGYWDRDLATFVTPAPSHYLVNAVRVTVRRTELRGNPLQLFFAQIIGNAQADVTVSAIAMSDHNLCGPFVGIEWVSVPGSLTTDSYDSGDGAYNVATAGNRGSLCSDGPIGVEGNAYINGDARAGKGYTVTFDGNPIVTGTVGSRIKPLNMEPVDATEAQLTNDNNQVPLIPVGNSWVSPVDANGNLYLDGNRSITLPAGTYCFNNVTLAGQAEVYFSGKTTVYITGNLSRAGGATFNNNTQLSGNVQIYMTGGTAELTSYDPFYGVIYAPNTDVLLDGSADYFGAIVGKTLTITGDAEGHYDEALGLLDDFPRRVALMN